MFEYWLVGIQTAWIIFPVEWIREQIFTLVFQIFSEDFLNRYLIFQAIIIDDRFVDPFTLHPVKVCILHIFLYIQHGIPDMHVFSPCHGSVKIVKRDIQQDE